MSQIDVERFLGRQRGDADFRREAAQTLGSVCCNAGLAFSGDEFNLLAHSHVPRLSPVAERLDDSLKRT